MPKQNLDASKVDAYIDEVIISDFDEPGIYHEDVIEFNKEKFLMILKKLI